MQVGFWIKPLMPLLITMSRCAYVLTRSIDSNFHQYLKKRPDISKDKDLLCGTYFPDEVEYNAHISKVGNSKEVSNKFSMRISPTLLSNYDVEEYMCGIECYGCPKSRQIQKYVHDWGSRKQMWSTRPFHSGFSSRPAERRAVCH